MGMWLTLRPKNVHYLTMNHWCRDDLRFYHGCKGRIWRWGYLTKVSAQPPIKHENNKLEIGWCGRMLDWKRVDMIIKAIALLPVDIREKVHVTLVGDGDQRGFLNNLAYKLGVSDVIEFRESMSAVSVLEFMRTLDVYVFPSNRNEGWGAALLESMNQGCAVIANVEAGSTLEVVKDGVSGFTFCDGDVDAVARYITRFVGDKRLAKKLGLEAWKSAQSLSPKLGAIRLVELIRLIQSGKIDAAKFEGLCERLG